MLVTLFKKLIIAQKLQKLKINLIIIDIQISQIYRYHRYIDTPEFNKLAADVFNARLAQANFVTKTDFDGKLANLNRKITKNKTDHLLVQNEFKTQKTFDLSYFFELIYFNYFEEDGTLN